eukprot:628739-Hanusia_phi.AAC.4
MCPRPPGALTFSKPNRAVGVESGAIGDWGRKSLCATPRRPYGGSSATQHLLAAPRKADPQPQRRPRLPCLLFDPPERLRETSKPSHSAPTRPAAEALNPAQGTENETRIREKRKMCIRK